MATVTGLTAAKMMELATELDDKIDAHIDDTSDAHNATAVSFSPTGNVQDAIDAYITLFVAHGDATSDAHDASAISFVPGSGIGATNAQAAIEEAKTDVTTILSGGAVGVIIHGATAGTTRPTEFLIVIWIGSVTPTNATNYDIWVDTT